MAKRSDSSKYWRKKADKAVTDYYKGKPCVICKSTYRTCGHHIVERSLSAYCRHLEDNIIPLCESHHKWSNEIAAHSRYLPAVVAFKDWLKENLPMSYQLLLEYKKYTGIKVNYRKRYEYWSKK